MSELLNFAINCLIAAILTIILISLVGSLVSNRVDRKRRKTRRRERIATAALQGLLAANAELLTLDERAATSQVAVGYADALIAQLDQ